MTTSTFVRARRPEHKQVRREAILAAARELACTSGVRNVSLGAVAEAAGLAKSNIARYFGTREEIYLELLAEEWLGWAQAVAERLRGARGAQDAVAALAETLVDRPLFCDLLSHAATSLEQHVSLPAARRFKHSLRTVMAAMGTDVARITDLSEREGAELVVIASSLAGAVYPATNQSPVLARLYAEDAELAASRPELLPTLVRTLTALAAGLPTLRDQPA